MGTGSNHFSSCIRGVGSQAAKENLRAFGEVEKACLLAPEKHRKGCFDAGLTYTYFADGRSKMPRAACEQTSVFREACEQWSHGR